MGAKIEFNFASDFKVEQASLAFKLPFTDRVLRLTAQSYKDPNAWCVGIGSECIDGKHVLFFDYDGKTLQQVLNDVKRIQEEEQLSNAYVFELDRENSFHVIIPAKFVFKEAFRILSLSNSDAGHQISAKKVRGHEWLLRTGPKGARNKPRYVGFLKSEFDYSQISTAHKKFIESNYLNVPKLVYKNEDNSSDLPFIDYNTGNRIADNSSKDFVGAKN